MSVDIEQIARNTQKALAFLTSAKNGAGALIEDPDTTAKDWGKFALTVAEAEGSYVAWARLSAMVEYKVANSTAVTEADVIATAFDLLSDGADDEWSGRENDVKRARFDGVRSACSNMKFL